MKRLAIFISVIFLLFQGCNFKQELTRDEALKQINKELEYPGVIDYDIYCGDPKYARRLLDAGLESEGLVTVQRTQKLIDAGKPFIVFTAKARPFLLPASEKDKATLIQKVKLANVEVVGITNIRANESGNKAVVDYSSAYKNVTPFAKLTTIDFNKQKENKTYFTLGDQGWKLEKKPGLDFVELEK